MQILLLRNQNKHTEELEVFGKMGFFQLIMYVGILCVVEIMIAMV